MASVCTEPANVLTQQLSDPVANGPILPTARHWSENYQQSSLFTHLKYQFSYRVWTLRTVSPDCQKDVLWLFRPCPMMIMAWLERFFFRQNGRRLSNSAAIGFFLFKVIFRVWTISKVRIHWLCIIWNRNSWIWKQFGYKRVFIYSLTIWIWG